MTKYFISYRQEDSAWAEWIAGQLHKGNDKCHLQAWDFHPGSNFVLEMHRLLCETERTIIVLSPSYIKGAFTQTEWAAVFSDDPLGVNRKLVPVRVAECSPQGLLKNISYIDLVGVLDKKEAADKLLKGLNPQKPTDEPRDPQIEPYFPNDPAPGAIENTYSEIIAHEFETAKQRLLKPDPTSATCKLLFGMDFPFGTDTTVKEVARCAILYDVRELLSATVGEYHAPESQWTESLIPHIAYKAASTRWRILVAAVGAGLNEFDEAILFAPLRRGLRTWTEAIPIAENLIKIATAYAFGRQDTPDLEVLEKILFYVGAICGSNGVRIDALLAEEHRTYRHIRDRTRADAHDRQIANIRNVQIYFRDQPGSYESLLRALAIYKINIFSSSSWTLLSGRVACSKLKIALPAGFSDHQLRSAFEQPLREGAIYRFELIEN